MKTLVKHLILTLAFLELPTRVPAQTVAELKASIDSLRAEVVQLRADLGLSGNFARDHHLDTPIRIRLHELGLAIDAGAAAIGTFESRLPPNGRTVQEYVNSAIAAAGTGGGLGNVVNGDLTVNGRVCLPTCRSDVPAAIQIRAQADAEIALESNLNHAKNEQGTAAHGAMISLASDGGLRFVHNNLHLTRPDGSWNLLWVEPGKPRTILGFDSQGTPSISQDKNGYIYPSQSIVVNFDDARKMIWLQSMKAHWTWGFCASPNVDNNCEGSYYTVPIP